MEGTIPRRAERWRVLPYDVGPSTSHFALSDGLVRLAAGPTLWWHSTDRPTLILGAGQSASDVDTQACRAAGVTVLKRHAGGTSVYADRSVLGLDVVLPANHELAGSDVVEAYRWLGEAWRDALHRTGITSHVLSVSEARSALPPPVQYAEFVRMACFGALSPYEVVAADRKLVGLAQVRRAGRVLLQSAVHLHFNAAALAALLPSPDREALALLLRGSAVGLDEMRTGTTVDSVMEAFREAMHVQHGITLVPGPWTPAEREHAAALEPELRSFLEPAQ